MIEDSLRKIGFSPTEIKIYLYLLRKGNSYANKISQEIRINRTNVYDALHRLISKGLVSYIVKNKIKWFEIKSFDSITTYIKEKEEDYNKIKLSLIEDIIEYKNNHKNTSKALEASIFTGKKGLKQLFEEILTEADILNIIASKYQFKSTFGAYFENWHRRRVSNKIFLKTIFPKSYKGKINKNKLHQIKFIDDKYTNPTSTFIYKDVCLFVQWSDEIIAIKIKDDKFAKSYLNQFNLLWDNIP